MGRYPHLPRLRVEGPADRRIVADAMAVTETAAFADRPLGTLSGGERQRVLIARAIAQQPRVLLLDEPTAALSPSRREGIFERLREVRERGVALLMVEQNAREALAISDRGYLLVDGRKAHEQPGPEMLANPDVGRMFLGLDAAAAAADAAGEEGGGA